MLAVGSDDPSTNAGGKVEIHVLNNSTRYTTWDVIWVIYRGKIFFNYSVVQLIF